ESIEGLNHSLNTGSLLVSTRLMPDTEVLLTIPGVNSVEPITDNKFIIHYCVSEDPCQQITETIITKGWGLQELSPIKKSLEDIFISLTHTSDS
ncbi:MAG: hypothetical protein RIQ94_3380, partial [Pseudomonadota bacterium]